MDVNEMAKYRESPEETHRLRGEVLECLVEGLHFLKSDVAVPAQKLANRILANIIIEHLDMSGFGIHRKMLNEEAIAAADKYFQMTAI